MSLGFLLQPAPGVGIQDGTLGSVVSSRPRSAKWRHPWFTRVSYSADKKQWLATVKAGYVNSACPIYRTTLRTQADNGRDFGTNPLTGEPYFSSYVFLHDAPKVELQTVEIPLYLVPLIPLGGWRNLADSAEVIPPLLASGIDSGTPAKERRQLRAIDLILHQPRVALTTETTIEPLITGQHIDRQILTTRPPADGDVLRVYSGTFTAPAALSDADAIDALTGQYEEQAYDELLISTVYMLSPPGARATDQPDGTWQAAVKHGLFWNLSWIPAPLFKGSDIAANSDNFTQLATTVALLTGGAAGGILAALTASATSAIMNDLIQQALNQVQAKSQAGTWWTPTGGGHTFAPDPVRVDAYDPLDKAARKAAIARAATIESQRAQHGIDPSFPHTTIGFPVERMSQFV